MSYPFVFPKTWKKKNRKNAEFCWDTHGRALNSAINLLYVLAICDIFYIYRGRWTKHQSRKKNINSWIQRTKLFEYRIRINPITAFTAGQIKESNSLQTPIIFSCTVKKYFSTVFHRSSLDSLSRSLCADSPKWSSFVRLWSSYFWNFNPRTFYSWSLEKSPCAISQKPRLLARSQFCWQVHSVPSEPIRHFTSWLIRCVGS